MKDLDGLRVVEPEGRGTDPVFRVAPSLAERAEGQRVGSLARELGDPRTS